MITFFAVLLRIVANPLANVFQKQLSQNNVSPYFVNFAAYLILSVLTIPFSVRIDWTAFSSAFWGNALLVGLLGAIGNGLLVAAIQKGEISVLGPINAYKSVIGLLIGIVLLHEIPGIFGCFGMILIIWGSYYAVTPSQSVVGRRSIFAIFQQQGVLLRFSAMLFSATEAIFIKRVVQLSNADVSMITWCWFGAFFALPMVWFRCQNKECKNKRWRNIKRQIYFALPEYKKYLLLAASIGVMQLSTNYAFRNMNVGYALALFQLSAIVSLFFGWRYFDEHGIFRKLLGSVIMISGSVLIILFGG